MDILNEFQKENMRKERLPEIKPGYTIRVHQKIKEGDRERIQSYEGLVISASGNKFRRVLNVRRVVDGVGIERIFRINAPNIVKIDITRKDKVRRAKLYYISRKEQKVKAREDKEGLKKVQEEIKRIQESASTQSPAKKEPKKEKEIKSIKS